MLALLALGTSVMVGIQLRHEEVLRRQIGDGRGPYYGADSTFAFNSFMRFRISALPTSGNKTGTTTAAKPFMGGNASR